MGYRVVKSRCACKMWRCLLKKAESCFCPKLSTNLPEETFLTTFTQCNSHLTNRLIPNAKIFEMEELQNSKIFNCISRPHYLFIVFIVIIQLFCVTVTNGAIATSKLTGTGKITSKETTSAPKVPSYNSTAINCPKSCICEESNGKKQLRKITCRHAGLKLFPTILRDEIPSSSWRFFETL